MDVTMLAKALKKPVKPCGSSAKRSCCDGGRTALNSFTAFGGNIARQPCESPRGTWGASRHKTRWR